MLRRHWHMQLRPSMGGKNKMRQSRESKVKRGFWLIAVLVTLGSITLQRGYAQQDNPTACTLATLHGRYVFDATGYNIVHGIAIPKTVVEFLKFKGDGSLTSIATVVVGGIKIQDDARDLPPIFSPGITRLSPDLGAPTLPLQIRFHHLKSRLRTAKPCERSRTKPRS